MLLGLSSLVHAQSADTALADGTARPGSAAAVTTASVGKNVYATGVFAAPSLVRESGVADIAPLPRTMPVETPAPVEAHPSPDQTGLDGPQIVVSAPQAAAADEPAAPRANGESLFTLHSDIKFSLIAPARKAADPAAVGIYAAQVQRISAELQTAARGLYPEKISSIGAFDVYVGDSDNLSAISSGSGRIAVDAGFARLNPTDDWLAFVIAREMGHVIAGHHDSNSGASILVSVLMNFIVPGSGLIKTVVSFAGSQMASESRHTQQNAQADEVALKLLEAAGYTKKSLALNLRLNPIADSETNTTWLEGFRVSALRIAGPLPGTQAPVLAREAAGDDAAPTPMVATAVPILAREPRQVVMPVVPPIAAVPTPANWQPEELMFAPRPSGLPGPLFSGVVPMPVRAF
jgi:hypothetical protein